MNYVYIKLNGTLSDALYQACAGYTIYFDTGKKLIVSVDGIHSDNKDIFKKTKQCSILNCPNSFYETNMKSHNLGSEFPFSKRNTELFGMFKNKLYFEHHRDHLYNQFEFKINPSLINNTYVYIDDTFVTKKTSFTSIIDKLLGENKLIQVVIHSYQYDSIKTELYTKYMGNNNIVILDNVSEYEKLCVMISCKQGGYYTGSELGFWASFFLMYAGESIEINVYKIKVLNNTSCFSNFNDNLYYSMTQTQFIEYFFPNIQTNLVTTDDQPSDIFIMGIRNFSSSKQETKINMLICIENLINPNFFWNYHYNIFGDYSDTRIKIYIYNHIDKIVKTNKYLAIPVIYFRINYFRLKKDYYFNHPDLQIPFSEKKFCLIINRSGINKKITEIAELLHLIGKVDNISMYTDYLKNKSCYNSIELLKVFNQYKFIICFENSYISNGYITEKIFNCFFSKSIPLYSGSEKINYYFNDNSFVNIKESYDYMSIIKDLNKNETLYNQYISNEKINNTYDDENFLEEMENYIDYELKNCEPIHFL